MAISFSVRGPRCRDIGVAGRQPDANGPPLVLDATIPLGEVSGRIAHLSIDTKRQRLFLPTGLSEPQGVAFVPFADSVYVANGGNGSVRVLRGEDLAPIGLIELGDDADNVGVDAQRHLIDHLIKPAPAASVVAAAHSTPRSPRRTPSPRRRSPD